MWYTCADSSVNGYTPNKLPQETQGGTWGVLGGHTFKNHGKLSNGWSDWHQLWFTSVDSSGNINTIRPSIPPGAWRGGGGLGDHKFKSLGKLSNGWTDWHQIWYTSVDSSWEWTEAKNNSPHDTPGRHFGWFYGINNSKFWEMWSNGWADGIIVYMQNADESGKGHRLNKLVPKTRRGAF